MAQSQFTISSVDYDINIQNYNEEFKNIIYEKPTILDPSDYDAGNSVIIANGVLRHVFSIVAWCDYATRTVFKNAFNNNTPIYPVIYPNNGTDNIITPNAFYYITNFNGNFKIGNENFWYNLTAMYGGV